MSSAFTIDDVLYQVRNMLQDQEKERYTDTHLLSSLNTAVSDMRRIRPDIVALQGVVPNYPFNTSHLNQGVRVPVDDMYYGPLISFVVGWTELADDEFTVDNRAATLLARFTNQLVAGG